MKAVTLTSKGGPEVLVLGDVPELIPAAGDIVVDVAAAAVNPVDLKTRSGFLDITLTYPAVLGWDVSGTVIAVGDDVRRFAVGDRVVGMVAAPAHRYGTYAELVVAGEALFAHAPHSVSLEHAAAIPLAGLTAAQTLASIDLGRAESVLVTGAAGAVGHIAVQLLLQSGHRVGAIARSQDLAALRDLGVDTATTTDDVQGEAWDAVVDTAGLASSIAAVRGGGQFVSIDDNDQPEPTRSITPTKSYVEQDGVGLAGLVERLDSGVITVPVARSYSFADAARAHSDLGAGGLRGKVVLIP